MHSTGTMRYATETAAFGELRDRFIVYQGERVLEEKFALVSQIPLVQGVELGFPADFQDKEKIRKLLEKHRLEVAAINVNLKAERRWKHGSLTATDARVRNQAINVLKEAMDVAAELQCRLITVCPLQDGHDYCFQRNYAEDWDNLVKGLREAADHRQDVRLSIEYKPNEPLARTVVSNVGKALYLCRVVDRNNVGVNLDVGHALYAGENVAESASLLSAEGKLFYIHLNDNFRDWDWDMIPGYVNFWDFLELFFYLRKYQYQGWIGTDVVPKYLDPVSVVGGTLHFAQNVEVLVEKIEEEKLVELMKKHDVPATFCYVQEVVLNLKK